MGSGNEKVRLQIPVSQEFATRISKLGECFKWSQSAMAAALLEEGVGATNSFEKWCSTLMADAVNIAMGREKVRAEGESEVYLQTFVDSDVVAAIERMALVLKNSPARVAANVIESAAHDEGFIIEALGTGPGQAVVKFLKSLKSGGNRKSARTTKAD